MQVTDVELVDALARRRLGLPPPPFAVHELNIFSFDRSDPSDLYEKFGGPAEPEGCAYFFCDQIGICEHNWKVASANERVVDAGEEVGCKVTLVFDDSRWGVVRHGTRWVMDEFDAAIDLRRGKIAWRLCDLRLYRLRRVSQQGPPRQQEARRVGGFRRTRLLE